VEYALDDIQAAFDSFANRPNDLKTQIVIDARPIAAQSPA